MLKKTHTSLKFSKWLDDKRFGYLPAKFVWIPCYKYPEGKSFELVSSESYEGKRSIHYNSFIIAYDILNDLCVKYVKEIFGNNYEYFRYDSITQERFGIKGMFYNKPEAVMKFLQQGKKEDAENFIMKNCILN